LGFFLATSVPTVLPASHLNLIILSSSTRTSSSGSSFIGAGTPDRELVDIVGEGDENASDRNFQAGDISALNDLIVVLIKES
jgi:hypothetical protein